MRLRLQSFIGGHDAVDLDTALLPEDHPLVVAYLRKLSAEAEPYNDGGGHRRRSCKRQKSDPHLPHSRTGMCLKL